MKISTKQYANALYELTEGKDESQIDDLITRFVAQMKKMGDIKKAKEVVNQFEAIYNKKNGIVKAVVTTTRKLTDTENDEVIEFIKKKYNVANVEMDTVIDKNIKGGIIIKVGDEVLDGSVNGRLNKLKLSLNQ